MKGRVLTALVSALLAAGAFGGVATAKPAPVSTPASIVLNEPDPHLGGSVTFTVAHSDRIKDPRVSVRCHQGAELVYGEAGPADHAFVLGGASSEWLRRGGGASCTAQLFYIASSRNRPQQVYTLATTSFEAAG